MNLQVYLGRGLDGDAVAWNPRGNAHLTITGQSGQGKSYKLCDMILQLSTQGVHTIILDGSGEYGRDAIGKPAAWPPRDARFLDISSPELPVGTFFPWAMPSAWAAMPSRPPSRVFMAAAKPLWRGPSRLAPLTRTSSRMMSLVG